jgi:hypothetical protein
MKTLIAAISLSLLSVTAFAQQKDMSTVKPAATPKKAAAPAYKCPVCGATSDKAGKCTKDKDVELVKVGDYYCPDCYMSSSKPGKCTMCGVEMKKMEASASTSATPAKK